MAKTMGTIRANIIANHGSITGKDSVILTILNAIQEDMSWNHKWRDLQSLNSSQTLSAAAYQITVPDTVQHIEFCKLLDSDGNWYDVDVLPLSDFRNLEDGSGTPVPANTDIPDKAHLIGSVLTFNKLASKALTVYLDCYIFPTEMSDTGDYPSITGIDNVFECYGTAWLYEHRHQPATAKVWFDMADHFYDRITNREHGVDFQFTRKRLGI